MNFRDERTEVFESDVPDEPLCNMARLIMHRTLGQSVSTVKRAIQEHVACCEVCNPPSLPVLQPIRVKVAQLSAEEFRCR